MQGGQNTAEDAGVGEDAAPDMAAQASARMAVSDFDNRMKLVIAHLLAGTAVLALWAAADAWQAVTGLAAASVLSVLAAIPAGAVFSTLVHEWCHFLGARLAGAAYAIPSRLGLFVFDYDFRHNSVKQFFTMSYGGQAGSVLGVLLLWWAVPMDTAGRAMLVCAAIGSGVFGAMIEWPVLARTRLSGNPGAELMKIDKALLYRSAGTGAGVTLALWVLLA